MTKETELILTNDGSTTIRSNRFKATYHSIHGAIQESKHVFIEAGLSKLELKDIRLLEIGFGTGLNTFMTLLYALEKDLKVDYTAYELFPISMEVASQLDYPSQLKANDCSLPFESMHSSPWNTWIPICPHFNFKKRKVDILRLESENEYDLIYFDAFAPETQPELWTRDVFKRVYEIMADGAILVTYCSKGDVRRIMIDVGLKVEKIPGPPGKREMLRAIK